MVTHCFTTRKTQDKNENDSILQIGFHSLPYDRVTGFQWHDICSIHARQTIFQTKTSSGQEV